MRDIYESVEAVPTPVGVNLVLGWAIDKVKKPSPRPWG